MFYLLSFSHRIEVYFGSGSAEKKFCFCRLLSYTFTVNLHRMDSPLYNLNIK